MIEMLRSDTDDPVRQPCELHKLTTMQRRVLERIIAICRAQGEEVEVARLARIFGVHHSTMQDHVAELRRKGWLRLWGQPWPVQFLD
jgi:hypothetical protein